MNKHFNKSVLVASCFLIAAAFSTPARALDDPLEAFPTEKKPAEQRVKALTAKQLDAIQMPTDSQSVVFSITEIPAGTTVTDENRDKLPEPYLQVFADGRVDCTNHKPTPDTARYTDKLSPAELTWLMHLIVNESKLMTLDSNKFDAALRARLNRSVGAAGDSLYYVATRAQKRDVVIPDGLLNLRPLRYEFGLAPFASVRRYVTFIIARAHLTPKERDDVLIQLNAQLSAELPGNPRFLIEHLSVVIQRPNQDQELGFTQVNEVGPKQFSEVMAFVTRNPKDGTQSARLNKREYSKR
jgi:hypothetical protein